MGRELRGNAEGVVGVFTMMSYVSSLGSMLAFAVSCAAAPAPVADAPEPPPPPPAPAPEAPPEEPSEAPEGGDGDASPPDEEGPEDGAEAPPPEPEPKEPEPKEPPQRQPAIEASAPAFINGEVPKVERFLAKQGERVAACVLKHGGLTEADGLIKMQFLVRMRGRAEGVEVLAARGVTEEAQRCARKRLKNEHVGTPTADPTGVTFTYRLKRRFR